MLFGVFLIAGMANPEPGPDHHADSRRGLRHLGRGAEFIVWSNDRRRARLHPDPYAGLADDEAPPVELDDAGTRDNMFT